MPELTICMPSNRTLAQARAAIDSAIAYCRERDALLVIADNSGDAEKKAYLSSLGQPVIYIESLAPDALGNMRVALEAVPTAFVMPMGDDDEIAVDPSQPAFDLSDLPFDYIGVTPVTVTYSPGVETERRKAFHIGDEQPGQRVIHYMEEGRGDNGSYYSAYRRDVFASLFHLFRTAHPTRGDYCDWAILYTLAAYGKLAHDSSTIYRYNFHKWDTAEKIEVENQKLYSRVGLPEDYRKYERLLQFLDVFILATRSGTTLSTRDRQRLSKDLVNIFMAGFVRQIADNPQDFDGTMRHLADMVLDEQDSFTQFQIGLMMADRVQAGLKDRYVEFVKIALGGG